jgi:pyruvate/2-oxoglutarate dehydrogenase complex dihydrolipoamide acyltransferase (E2) component
MVTKVIMPQLGESVVEGTVTKWLKLEGDSVEEFEPLIEINTDKVDTEVPSPAQGTLLKRYIPEGETVRAGTLLAVIGTPGEAIPEGELETAPAARASTEVKATPSAPAAARSDAPADVGFISPVVARIASEHRVDLSQVRGTGHGGRITKKDVMAFVENMAGSKDVAPWDVPASGELFRPTEEVFGSGPPAGGQPTSPAPGSVIPLDAVRRTIADHMLRSKHTSPHVTTVMEADMSRVVAHRRAQRERFVADGVNLTFTAYFVAASVAALKAVPIVNASWSVEGIVLHKHVNIGVAVSLGERGLIVPVIREADQKSLLALAKEINDLAARARNRQLSPDDVQGGTFTITNHGVSGSLFATPIINQPQAAILGVGALQKRVLVIETSSPSGGSADAIVIRPMVYLTLTFDHRILDGAIGDQFLGAVVQRLETWT